MRSNKPFLAVILYYCIFKLSSTTTTTTPDEFSNVELNIAEEAIKEANEQILNTPTRNFTSKKSFIQREFTKSYVKFPLVAELIGRDSNANLRAYQILVYRYGIPRERALQLLRRLVAQSELCNPRVYCRVSNRYRSVDGSCNNIHHPRWGAALTAFKRLVPTSYKDGFGEPRGGYPAIELPNARHVSSTLHPDLIHPDPSITNMVPQVGQFIDHDLTLTPEAGVYGALKISSKDILRDRKCCTTDRNHVDCWPIRISSSDNFYSTLPVPQSCMDFTRSTAYCFPTQSGIREQFNILTAYLDLSQVYGSDEVRANQLRGTGGLMRTSDANPKFLPTVAQVETLTHTTIEFKGKFLAGDERVNEMPALATMHTLWIREHNRVATEMKLIRPSWDHEKVFQETRRIVIAEWQNVVYGEWLPVILGNTTIRQYGLELSDTFSSYDPTADATILHSFASAAMRFGHTLINGIVSLLKGLSKVGQYRVRDNFFESEQLEQNGGDGYNLILGGLMIQNAQTYDRFVTEDLTNHLLKKRTELFGSDLIARNIQRGREHGIRPYNDYRIICNLRPLRTWRERPHEIPLDSWRKLQDLYRSPLDIDLFSAGIAETPVPGGVSGATFNCLKAKQFRLTRFGDRFFFTHRHQVASFSPNQLQAIRKRTLGDVICDNSNLEQTPKNVFRVLSSENSRIPCSSPGRRLHLETFVL